MRTPPLWVARASGVLLFLLLACSCKAAAQDTRTVSHVVYVTQVAPPATWKAIYHEVEACYGKRGNFAAVRWYVAPDVWQGENGDVAGLWRPGERGPQIIVVRGDTAVVRHEALHDVMYANGFKPVRVAADTTNNPEHPIPPFDECAQRKPELTGRN